MGERCELSLSFEGTAAEAAFAAINVGATIRIAKERGAQAADLEAIEESVATALAAVWIWWFIASSGGGERV
ncbi:MAG: hypothetical protein ACR2PG_13445 [Hyphomicrobiaceae bacterium]